MVETPTLEGLAALLETLALYGAHMIVKRYIHEGGKLADILTEHEGELILGTHASHTEGGE